MRRIVFLGWMLFLTASLFAGTGSGGKWGKLLKRYGQTENIQPGAWVAYRIHTVEKGQPKTLDWKMACVGEEKVDGKDGVWLEVEVEIPESDVDEARHIITKTLIVGKPSEKQTVEKVIFQADNRPPMEMHVGKDLTDDADAQPLDFEDLGKETVTVPAGTFVCQHLRTTNEDQIIDVYVNDEVALYGMVKMQSGDEKMELQSYGAKGAVSQIKGEPINPMDMQQMMQNMKDFKLPKSDEEGK